MTRKEKLLKAAEFDEFQAHDDAEAFLRFADATKYATYVEAQRWYHYKRDKRTTLLTALIEENEKLREALGRAHLQACSCCDSNIEVHKHCEEALLPGKLDELIEGEK